MARKYRRLTLVQGAVVSAAGLFGGVIAWQVALLPIWLPLRFLLFLFGWFALWFFSHSLTHHIVGHLCGIRFRYYFLGRSAIRKLSLPLISRVMEPIPIIVLKVDSASVARARPRRRKWMHVSGAIVSMLLPWLIVPSTYGLGIVGGLFFTLLTGGNDLFTLYFSPKTGDLYRAKLV